MIKLLGLCGIRRELLSEILLSICIPTYNRCDNVYSIVKNCLSSKNINFEIIVSDNCSTDDTVEKLQSINDNRLVILQSDKNYGTYINGNKALLNGNGKYLMFLMDKDYITIDYIDTVIDYLRHNDFAVGLLKQDYNSDVISYYRFPTKIEALRLFCFVGNHPSGFLFNRDLLNKYNIFEACSSYDKKIRAFYTDFISSMFCEYGDAVILNIPFVHLVKPPFKGLKHSYTYSFELKNLFFTPEYRFHVFEIYIEFLNSKLSLKIFERFWLLKYLIRDLFNYSTRGYLSVLNDKNICDWYSLPSDFILHEKNKNLCKNYCKLLLKSLQLFKSPLYFFAVISFYFWYFKCGKKNVYEVINK